jgi:hypothetical protein
MTHWSGGEFQNSIQAAAPRLSRKGAMNITEFADAYRLRITRDACGDRGHAMLQYAYAKKFVPVTAAGFQNQEQVDQTMAALKDKTFMAQHFPHRFAEWVKTMEGKKS